MNQHFILTGQKKSSFKKKFFKKILIFGVVLVLLLGVASGQYYKYLLSPANSQNTTKQGFVVEQGEGTSVIATKLEQAGLIKSALAFKIFIKLSGDVGKIQAGDFALSPAMSMHDIVQELMTGKSEVKVTLLEGWRVEEMAQKFHDTLGLSQDEFIKQAKEGYMFPDTYLFNKDVTVQDVVSTLENNFNQKYTDELKTKVRKQGLTPDQGIILASIIEREARSDEARTMVASILLKRLKIGMALDTDATVQYALGYQSEQQSWWKKDLTLDDLKVDSPYNTYIINGLPPAPICNPSLLSLEAVANADPATPYLYYYHDSDGNAHYSTTLEQHDSYIQQFK